MMRKGNTQEFRRERAQNTDLAANSIIAVEREKKALKTERLRAARLEEAKKSAGKDQQ
ncbi:hypothetical protein [Aureimonas fodinaquatilis]|uniref:hypothetical protein n=1 Tax=Aureimonas fodinaquatilis TaxID=2565783 RepID=UPI001AED9824|nr:hypothetical protein [Aureimonas fodinaquatilis]